MVVRCETWTCVPGEGGGGGGGGRPVPSEYQRFSCNTYRVCGGGGEFVQMLYLKVEVGAGVGRGQDLFL